jgi:hypothetical protein
MTSSTSNPKTAESSKVTEPAKQDAQPHLGVLEEDDEFEEFPVAGSFYHFQLLSLSDTILILF